MTGEVRHVDLTSRRRTDDVSTRPHNSSPRPVNNRQSRLNPDCHESRVYELIEPLKDKGWANVVCAYCDREDIPCVALTNCCDSGSWCWVCQVKIGKQKVQKDKGDTQSTSIRCGTCKELLQPAFLTREHRTWTDIAREGDGGHVPMPYVPNAHAYCCDESVLNGVEAALSWLCWYPECNLQDFKNESAWRAHLMKVHERKVCDICFRKTKDAYLPCQHKLYKPAELARHRKEGAMSAHVKCPACGSWEYDDEAFFNHWSRSDDHIDCQFCRAEGDSRAIFSSFALLQEHHKQSHFVCNECSAVFGDYQNLARHTILEHPRGKRGVVSLAELEAQATMAASAEERDEQTRQPDPPGKQRANGFWPDPMIAVSNTILTEVKRNLKGSSAKTGFYDKAYRAALANLCGETQAELFRRNFEAFLKNDGEVDANDLLGELAHIVWTSYWLMFKRISAQHKMVADRDYMTQDLRSVHLPAAKAQELEEIIRQTLWQSIPSEESYWIKTVDRHSNQNSHADPEGPPPGQNSRRGPISWTLPCEVISYFILHIPTSTHASRRDALIKALEAISEEAPNAEKRLRNLNTATPGSAPGGAFEEDSDTAEMSDEASGAGDDHDPVTGYLNGPILANLRSLPIRANLPFVKAAYWAILEFMARCGHTSMNDLKTIPPDLVADMSTQRSRSELEMCLKLVGDLACTDVSPSDLDLFLSLRPKYLSLSRTPQTVGARRGAHEMNTQTRWMVSWRMQAWQSRRWGAQVEQILRRINKPNLWCIKEYCKASIQLLPNAVGILPQLTGGIPAKRLNEPRSYVTVDELRRVRNAEDASRQPSGVEMISTTPSPPQRAGGEAAGLPAVPGYLGYNTWNQQTFRPSGQLCEEQYPPLPEPMPTPPGLTGHKASPKPGARSWTRQSYYQPALQICGTCREEFDPDVDRCPKCATYMHLTSSQRARNLMSNEEYPSIGTTSQPPPVNGTSARRWARKNPADDLVRTYTGRSGPPKRF